MRMRAREFVGCSPVFSMNYSDKIYRPSGRPPFPPPLPHLTEPWRIFSTHVKRKPRKASTNLSVGETTVSLERVMRMRVHLFVGWSPWIVLVKFIDRQAKTILISLKMPIQPLACVLGGQDDMRGPWEDQCAPSTILRPWCGRSPGASVARSKEWSRLPIPSLKGTTGNHVHSCLEEMEESFPQFYEKGAHLWRSILVALSANRILSVPERAQKEFFRVARFFRAEYGRRVSHRKWIFVRQEPRRVPIQGASSPFFLWRNQGELCLGIKESCAQPSCGRSPCWKASRSWPGGLLHPIPRNAWQSVLEPLKSL